MHLAWATEGREPLVEPGIERAVHRCIEQEARDLGCSVLAIIGMPDHVHLVVKMPGRLSAAELAKQTKGVSSRLVNSTQRPDLHFAWQEGYAAYSICKSHVSRIVRYVENQKDHHRSGALWASLEEVDEETPDKTL
jgi:REP element-mobilizing transposase RayT